MIYKVKLVVFALANLVFVWHASANSEAEQHSVIAVFGDSITVGENVSSYYFDCGALAFGSPVDRAGRPGFGLGRTDYCNPDREVEKLLDESERPSTVVNWGIGGTLLTPISGQAFTGVGRIQSALNQTRAIYPSADDYIVLIMYGTNDVSFGVGSNTIGFNTRVVIDQARAVGWTPVVANLLPRSALPVSSANQQIQAAAANRNAPFVDQFSNFIAKGGVFALHEDETGARISERLHPNAMGYQVVAQQWFDAALAGLITPIPPPPPVVAPIIGLLLDDDEEL